MQIVHFTELILNIVNLFGVFCFNLPLCRNLNLNLKLVFEKKARKLLIAVDSRWPGTLGPTSRIGFLIGLLISNEINVHLIDYHHIAQAVWLVWNVLPK